MRFCEGKCYMARKITLIRSQTRANYCPTPSTNYARGNSIATKYLRRMAKDSVLCGGWGEWFVVEISCVLMNFILKLFCAVNRCVCVCLEIYRKLCGCGGLFYFSLFCNILKFLHLCLYFDIKSFHFFCQLF